MKLHVATIPPSTSPTDPDTDRAADGAPGAMWAPTMGDSSATASASLDQVARYVGMLHAALGEDPSFYARLVTRGFLDIAIDYARYAQAVMDHDGLLDDDHVKGMIQRAVLEALLTARRMGIRGVAERDLADELDMARAAAANAARALESLVGSH